MMIDKHRLMKDQYFELEDKFDTFDQLIDHNESLKKSCLYVQCIKLSDTQYTQKPCSFSSKN